MGSTKTVDAQLSLPFPGGKCVAWKKVKALNISATIQLIFFLLSPCIWENNGLLNKNYWDGLDIIGQDHIRSKVSI